MKRFLIVGGLMLLALAAAGQTKPDFSGTWTLDLARSSFEYPPLKELQGAVAVIDHREPLFKFKRAYRFGGKDDEASFEHTTDGRETEGQEGSWKAVYSMKWDGDVLVRLIRLQTPRGEALNTYRFSLQEGGKVLRIEERFKGPLRTFDNLWIYRGKLPEK